MNDQRTYCVGGHLFALDFPPELLSEKELAPYAPFRTACRSGGDVLFSLSLVDDAASLPPAEQETAAFEDENGRMTLFAMPSGGLAVHLSTPPILSAAASAYRMTIAGLLRGSEAAVRSGTMPSTPR